MLTGIAEANSNISIIFSDATHTIAITTADATGSWNTSSTDISSLTDGNITITATATDIAGNISATNTTVVKDTIPPATPTLVDLATSSDVGVGNDNDNSTIDFTPTFTGTGTPGDTVSLYASSTIIGSTIITAGGTWSITSIALIEGTHTISAYYTDPAGNESGQSPILTIYIDIQVLTIDTPVTQDGIINVLEQSNVAVSGSASSDGNTIIVTITGSNNNSASQTLTTNNLAKWSTNFNLTSFAEGDIVIEAFDSTANAQASITITKDSQIPTPTITTPITGDGVINSAEIVAIPVTGTAEASSSVNIIFSASNTTEATTLIANSSGLWTITAIDLSVLDDGTITISATATDIAGNISPTTNTIITKDTTITLPTIATIAGDNIINFSEQTIVLATGTAEANSSVNIIFSASNTTEATTVITNSSGLWTITSIDLSTLVDGTITISATATDYANNISPATNTIITKDTVSTTPTIDTVAGDNIINSNEQTTVSVTGTAEASSSVNIVFTDTLDIIESITVITNSSGLWTIASINLSALADGTITIRARATDIVSNISVATNTIITKDTVSPTIPTIATVADDNIVNSNEVSSILLTGTAEASSSVNIIFSASNTTEATTLIANSSGLWTITAIDLSVLDDGTITISATATDIAGNISPTTNTIITKDTTITLPTIATIAGDNIINFSEQTIVLATGTAEANSSVNIIFSASNTTEATTVITNSSGLWTITSIDLSTLVDGTITISATATDYANNISPATNTIITKDTVSTTPTIDTVAGDNIINSNEQTTVSVTGTAEASSSVNIVFTDTLDIIESITVMTNSSGLWTIASINLSALADGTITIRARATDIVSNISVATNTIITKDTVSPTIPTIATVADDNIVNSNEVSSILLTGTAEASSSVNIIFSASNTTEATILIANSSGLWTITAIDLSVLDDGTITISATATDIAGNISPATNTTILKDTLLPATIVINTPIAEDGIISSAEATSVLVSGTAEASNSINIIFSDVNNTFATTTVANASGLWSVSDIDLSAFDEGIITIYATSTDEVGNTSPQLALI